MRWHGRAKKNKNNLFNRLIFSDAKDINVIAHSTKPDNAADDDGRKCLLLKIYKRKI